MSTNVVPPRTRLRWALALLSVSVLLTSACAGSAGQSSSGQSVDTSVEYGASIDDFQAAFADIDPITLRYQTLGSGPESATGKVALQFAEDVNEWSDGKIEIEVNWNGAIAGLEEVDSALEDGRLDLAEFATTYNQQKYPITNNMIDATVRGSLEPLSGELVRQLAMVQAVNDTDAVFEEFASNGMTAIFPVVTGASVGLACSEEITSIDDLKGRQVMTNSAVQNDEIEALGATVTSIDYSEVYSGFERSILDCALVVPNVYSTTGLYEVAPFFYYPDGTDFQAGPNTVLAGSSWESLPLIARQLIYDKFYEWLQNFNNSLYSSIDTMNQLMADSGRRIELLGPSVSEALKEATADIARDQAESTAYDAAGFAQRYEESLTTWSQTAEELGYVGGGEYSNVGDWFEGDLNAIDDDYLDEIYFAAYPNIAERRRPT